MYTGICQLNQQMILAAGPLDVNPTAVLLLQPLFLLLSPVGYSAAAHRNQSSFPLLAICDSTVASSPSPGRSSLGALGTVWSTWSTTESHRKMIVRERLTVGTHHAHVDHAAPREPGRWMMARPRKGTTQSRGRCDSGCPRVEEYDGSLVRCGVRLLSLQNNRGCG